MAVLTGTLASETLAGTTGNDSIDALGGHDVLSGEAGADTLLGGAGNDTLYSAAVTPDFSYPYHDIPGVPPVLDTAAEVDILSGGAGEDSLFAGWGDHLDGGGGDDILFISLRGAPAGVEADLRTLGARGLGTGSIANIEEIGWLEGSDFDDVLAVAGNTVVGAPIYGHGGNDQIIAGYYTGHIFGGAGDDHIDVTGAQYSQPVHGDEGNDTIVGGLGYESLEGGAGHDVILADEGFDRLSGGEGDDYLDGGGWRDIAQGGAGNDSMYGGGGDDSMEGGAGNDLLLGDESASAFSQPHGPDTLRGGAGADTISGGGSDDLLEGGAGNDVIDGGAGDDIAVFAGLRSQYQVVYSAASATFTIAHSGTDGTDTVSGVESFQFANGIWSAEDLINGTAPTGGDNYMTGTAAADSLNGGNGMDTVVGLAGADTLLGGDGSDWLFAADAPGDLNPFYSHQFPPLLDTGAQVDSLSGGADDDRLFAGYGDHVDGGNGFTDTLYISFMAAPSGVTANFSVMEEGGTLVIGGGTIQNVEVLGWVEGSNFADTITAPDTGDIGFAPMYGRGGDDRLTAGYYTGNIYGGTGNDFLDMRAAGYSPNAFGEQGNDTIEGGSGYESMSGGEGNDSIAGNAGFDSITGGSGNDWIDGGSYTDTIDGGEGADTIYGSSDKDHLLGGDGDDRLYGDFTTRPVPDGTVSGQVGDTLDGGAGNDTLSGDRDDDLLEGGAGTDVAVYAGNRADYAVSIEPVTGAYIIEDSVEGRDGTDTVSGVESFQFLDGAKSGPALTMFNGTTGKDTLLGSAGGETIDAGAGNDSISAAGGNDTIIGGAGNDWIDGGAGSDTASYANATQGVTVSLSIFDGQNTGGGGTDTLLGIENLVGSPQADTLTGSNAANVLAGGSGNDSLTGGAGDDTLEGGAGNDRLLGGDGNDLLAPDAAGASGRDFVDGGAGSDTLSYADYGAGVIVDLAASSTSGAGGIDTLAGIEHLWGSSSGDHLTGDALANTIDGRAGPDTLVGGGGNDVLTGGADADVLSGGTGNDTLTGNTGSDVLDGGEGNDSLLGAEGNDVIDGGGGADWIEGGDGNDRLSGGAANDTIRGGTGDNLLEGGAGDDFFVAEFFAKSGIDGGSGFDVVEYPFWYYPSGLTRSEDGSWVASLNTTDIIANVERLHYYDRRVALDVDGNAGLAARMTGVALGSEAVQDLSWMKLVLGVYDSGMTNAQVADLAVSAVFGGMSDLQFVSRVYENIAGAQPIPELAAVFVNLLATGAFTRSTLLQAAAATDENAYSIGLAQIELTGLSYAY